MSKCCCLPAIGMYSPPEQGLRPLTLRIDTSLGGGLYVIGSGNPGSNRMARGYGLDEELIIDWGDGNVGTILSHTYAEQGEYVIKVYGGTGSQIMCGNKNLVECVDFGSFEPIGIRFRGSSNLVRVPSELPESIISLYQMFAECAKFNGDVSGWEVGRIKNFHGVFSECSVFNSDVSQWDMRNADDTSSMFAYCSVFNIDISQWDTSNVSDMSYMFAGTTEFNPNIGVWDVHNVLDMTLMFYEAEAFNQDLSNWCVENIPNEPGSFSTNTPQWTLPKPNWGAPCL